MNDTLSLAPLWFRIEHLLNSTAAGTDRSPIEAQAEIAQSLQELLWEFGTAFAREGVLGAAFLFSNGNGDGWSLFERQSKRLHTDADLARAFEAVTSVSTPYIIRPAPQFAADADALRSLVHHSFVEVREIQEKASETSGVEPEFFAWLPRPGLRTFFQREAPLRDLLSIHYVGEGELAVALMTWRTLQALDQLAQGGGSGVLDAASAPADPPDTWVGHRLAFGDADHQAGNGLVQRLCAQQTAWIDEARFLLTAGNAFDAVRAFAADLGVEVSEGLQAAEILQLAEAYAAAISAAAVPAGRSRLAVYEGAARAPLPAYYFWRMAEGRTHAHLVAPIWTSAMNPLRLQSADGEEIQPAVGLALSAVSPITELEAIIRGGSAEPGDGRRFYQTLSILSMLRQISRPLVEFVFYEPAKRRERAAQANQLVAAIMSRNLSHNIGSHVLYHLREDLELRQFEEVDRLLAPEVTKDRRIADLIKYLQARMDFIALVSSEGATWPGVVSLDSLRAPYLDPGSLLLKHIVKSQRLRPPLVKVQTESEARGGPPENPDFAIPTGAVGSQALYSIIENFIRNSAKYGTAAVEADLHVSLIVKSSDHWPDHWECVLSDNNRSVVESAKRVVDSFDRPIFDPRDPGQSHRNWGLKEMKIAALFLAGGGDAVRSQYRAGDRGYDGPQPEWVLADAEDEECSLQLRFHLMRPLGICLIGQGALAAFKPHPLMHVFASPGEMLAEASGSGRRYEMIVTDREALDRLGSARSAATLMRRAMRLSHVGGDLGLEGVAEHPDVLSLAPGWPELAAAAAASGLEPWHAIGADWANRRWPGKRTVFASAMPSAEPEMSALADLVVGEFDAAAPLPEEASQWLVWDHTRHREDPDGEPPVYERFAFHRPVSHPVRVGLGLGDGSWRLKEAACLQIGVIDERIWGSREKMAKDQGYKKVPFYASSLAQAWGRAGVHLLDAGSISRWSTQPDGNGHPLLAQDPELPAVPARLDFLVVHRSLVDKAASLEVERLRLSAHEGRTDARDEFVFDIMGWLRLATHKLIVTSGRGLEPAYLKVLDATGAGFVEFSALDDALTGNTGDKVGLVKLLRSV